MLRYIEQLVSIILTYYYSENFKAYRTEIRDYFKRVETLVEQRGLPEAIAYVKASRLAVTRYISGAPLKSLPGVRLIEGWPGWLLPLKPLKDSIEGKKVLMTLLVAFRNILLTPKLDLSPIISPWKGRDTITERELNHALRCLGVPRKGLRVEWEKFHMSTKSGPIGQALTSSVTELSLLPEDLISSIKELGGSKLSNVIDNLRLARWGTHSLVSIWASIFKAKKTLFRKISYFADKEGKTRVIAIFDYWSQTCLKPYHDAINRILRKVRPDCTFNQNSIFETLPTLGPYHSLDLSNATDRMPLALQLRVFEKLFGKAKALAWANLLVGYEFATKDGPHVKYGAGQPMGAYSSWSSMALTHHVMVRVSAMRVGYPHFKDYTLLGDDLVIANDAVAGSYRELCAQLDMPISEAKTHVSSDTFEFAKRWFTSGVEFTGFPVGGLKSVWKSYALLHNFLDTQRLHGWCIEKDKHPGLITAICSLLGKPEQSVRIVKLYMVFDAIPAWDSKSETDWAHLLQVASDRFAIDLSSLNPQALPGDYARIAFWAMVRTKKVIVERDLDRFSRDAYKVSAKLTGTFLKFYPDLSVQDYRAALRGNVPLVTVLNGMILEAVDIMRRKFGRAVALQTARSSQFQALTAEEGEVDVDNYLQVGISKYFVSRGVFTMRASHAITLAKAQFVKAFISSLRREDLSALMTEPIPGESVNSQ
nr:MAG: putative RNA-dependent RNA polymerase [Mitoviridae sp.]